MSKPFIILSIITLIALSLYLATEVYHSYYKNDELFTASGPDTDSKLKYNKDNLDIKYHDDPTMLDEYGTLSQRVYVLDNKGKMQDIPASGSGTSVTYNKPGAFKYDQSKIVPNYEDSVYLSRTANVFKTSKKNSYETASVKGGICNYYKTNLSDLENACRSLDPNVCAATNCCVLLGGSKCISGNQNGPTFMSNYGDPLLINRDFYYYQGKCFGNCYAH
uniref:Uncharacterized protein n=1 Tax=viral metagenome TaxID=1070528 RepID=A0A6C0JJF4_9ZZZZ